MRDLPGVADLRGLGQEGPLAGKPVKNVLPNPEKPRTPAHLNGLREALKETAGPLVVHMLDKRLRVDGGKCRHFVFSDPRKVHFALRVGAQPSRKWIFSARPAPGQAAKAQRSRAGDRRNREKSRGESDRRKPGSGWRRRQLAEGSIEVCGQYSSKNRKESDDVSQITALTHGLGIKGHPLEISGTKNQKSKARPKSPRHLESGQLALAGASMEDASHGHMVPIKREKIKFLLTINIV